MKVKYLIIVQLVISCFSFSQEKDLKKKDVNKGWYFGPNVSYSAINGFYNRDYGFDNTYFNNHLTYALGADVMYAFGRKHTITFGIHYSETRVTYSTFWVQDSIFNPDKISFTSDRYTNQYLLLPVQMNFCLFKGSISPYIITGFSPAIYSGYREFHRTTYMNGSQKETRDSRYSYQTSLSIFSHFGFGLDVNVNKNKLRVFVYHRSYYGPVLFGLLVNGLWDYSIHTGISYYFKK